MKSAAAGPLLALAFIVGGAAPAHAVPCGFGSPVTAAPEQRAPMVGKLLDVQDGDSFRIIVRDGTPMHIRIAGIDAPERGQPFADESRAALRTLLARRSLHIRVLTTDRFGRLVADVDNGERDVGLAQVHAGLAWHFKRFAPTQPPPRRMSFAYAEQQARQLRLGLWQQATPQTPWEHRSHRRGVHQEIP